MNQQKASAKLIGAAAALLAVSQLASRFLGYGREVLLAYQVGAGSEADAYVAAFTVPDLLNYLLAGSAFSLALIPMYTRRRERSGEAEADAFFGKVLGTLGAITIVLTLVAWLFSEVLVEIFFDGFDPQTRVLTARLMRIVLPAQVFFVLGGIIKAPLLARGRFGAAALAPVIYNIFIIVGGALLAPSIGVEGFAWGVLVGAALGPFLVPLLDARGRVSLNLKWAPTDKDFLGYLWLALPLMLGVSLLTFDDIYARIFGADLATGTVAHLNYARKLMQLPVAIVGQAVATAALPAMAQLHAEGQHEKLNATMTKTLRATLGIGLLGACGAAILAQPIVQVVYRHGAFSSEDSTTVAAILSIYSLAVPAWVMQQVQARAFYARQDTWRPMILGSVIAIGAVPLYLAGAKLYGIQGLVGAGVLGMTLNAGGTIAWGRKRHGGPDLVALASTALRTAVALAPASIAAWFVVAQIQGQISPNTFVGALAALTAGGLTLTVIAVGLLFWVGDADTVASLRRILKKLRVLR